MALLLAGDQIGVEAGGDGAPKGQAVGSDSQPPAAEGQETVFGQRKEPLQAAVEGFFGKALGPANLTDIHFAIAHDALDHVPPQAIVTARIVTSPGHLKRIVRALAENLDRYESKFGPLEEAPEPSRGDSVN